MSISCDILVAGGGVAGVPAAVAAARTGARVVLVERDDFLGGTGVTALHRYICGLYVNGPEAPTETLNAGLVREIIERLKVISPASHPLQMGRVWGFPFEPAQFREVFEELAQAEPKLTVLMPASVEAAQCTGQRIESVTVQTSKGTEIITPRAVIDATGSGTLIRLSGAPFNSAPEPERQLAGCTVHLDGITGDRQLLGIKIAWRLSRLPATETALLPPFAGFAAGSGSHDGFCKFSISPELAKLGCDVVTDRLARLHALLAAHLPELANSRIVAHSGPLEREGIRLAGIWELDERAILEGRKFKDGIARNAWPIEFWGQSDSVPHYAYPPEDDYYEIPSRCLRSGSISNLFAAGRCISASNRALASTRVMGTCMALGEAAGTLSTLFVNQHQP